MGTRPCCSRRIKGDAGNAALRAAATGVGNRAENVPTPGKNEPGFSKDWKNPAADAEAYGASFAKEFGPGGRWPFVDWVEIGNEPGLYDDESYRTLFRAMARGIRAGNPKMKIVTSNVEAEKSDRYWKGTEVFKDMGDLYDVLQIHRYAIAEQWPVWRRTYPENPAVPYLSSIKALLDWRDKNAVGKPVWVTGEQAREVFEEHRID